MAKKLQSIDTGMELIVADRHGGRSLALQIGAPTTENDPQSFSLDPFGGIGATFRGKPILDLEGVKGQIDSGTVVQVPNDTITYAFLDKSHLVGVYQNPNFGFSAGLGLGIFSDAQKAAARASVTLWDDLIPQTFVESKTKGAGADIIFANSADPAQAYAYYPTQQGYNFQSDVFIADPALNFTNNWLTPGGYGNTTLIHELGHTLGLSHPGAYNFDPNVPQTYVGLAEYAQDSEQYSIMSYWRGSETGARTINWSLFLQNNSQTPMLHDILTIQSKYGADLTTRVGDTIYGFNTNAGNAVFDFAKNPYPYLSVYDAAGNDTIDLSGFTAGQQIDLHAGSFSSVGQALPSLAAINAARADFTTLAAGQGVFGPLTQASVTATGNSFLNANAASIQSDTGVGGVFASEYSNFSIAYGTMIENAIGGSARDVIWGNEVANRLEGRGGNDVLRGFEGNDTLLGGDGNDVLRGDSGRDTLTGGAGTDVFDFRGLEVGDRITDFQTGVDKIDLTGIRNATNTGSFDFTWIGDTAFSGTAGELRFANGVLEADTNGDKVVDFSVFVGGDAPVQTDVLFG